jgi:hypothetical protein
MTEEIISMVAATIVVIFTTLMWFTPDKKGYKLNRVLTLLVYLAILIIGKTQ